MLLFHVVLGWMIAGMAASASTCSCLNGVSPLEALYIAAAASADADAPEVSIGEPDLRIRWSGLGDGAAINQTVSLINGLRTGFGFVFHAADGEGIEDDPDERIEPNDGFILICAHLRHVGSSCTTQHWSRDQHGSLASFVQRFAFRHKLEHHETVPEWLGEGRLAAAAYSFFMGGPHSDDDGFSVPEGLPDEAADSVTSTADDELSSIDTSTADAVEEQTKPDDGSTSCGSARLINQGHEVGEIEARCATPLADGEHITIVITSRCFPSFEPRPSVPGERRREARCVSRQVLNMAIVLPWQLIDEDAASSLGVGLFRFGGRFWTWVVASAVYFALQAADRAVRTLA